MIQIYGISFIKFDYKQTICNKLFSSYLFRFDVRLCESDTHTEKERQGAEERGEELVHIWKCQINYLILK